MIRRHHTPRTDTSTAPKESVNVPPACAKQTEQSPTTQNGERNATLTGSAPPKTLAQRALHRVRTAATSPDAKRRRCRLYSKTCDLAEPNRNLMNLGVGQIAPPQSPEVRPNRPAAPAESPTSFSRLHHLSRRVAIATTTVAAIAAGAFLTATPAQAATPTPNWRLVVQPAPKNMSPGGEGQFAIFVENIGDAPSNGEPVTVVDQLPAGMVATEAGALPGEELEIPGEWGNGKGSGKCEIAEISGTSTVTCTYEEAAAGNEPIRPYEFDGRGRLTPGQPQEIGINVEVPSGPEGQPLTDEATISGGGAPASATDKVSTTISSTPAPFGVEAVHEWFTNRDGTPDTQAGSHPYEMATSVTLNVGRLRYGLKKRTSPSGEAKDIHLDLPPGFLGNPNSTPQCPLRDFYQHTVNFQTECSPDTQVGVARVVSKVSAIEFQLPIYNLVPPAGLPAQFAFSGPGGYEGIFDFGVATGAGYNLTVDLHDLPEVKFTAAMIDIWGNPADPSHDAMRFLNSTGELAGESGQSIPFEGPTAGPLLSLPTRCGPFGAQEIRANSWEDPLELAKATPLGFSAIDENGQPLSLVGCNKPPFAPEITSKPTTNVVDSPSGLDFDLHFPQTGLAEPEAKATEAHLRQAVVTLPQGLTLNPSSANGLAGCSAAQFGLTSKVGEAPIATTPGPAECPQASKIGSLEVQTPLLDEHNSVGEPTGRHTLNGSIYLAKPLDNPFGGLIAIYLAVNDPQTGIVVKLAGHVEPDPATGQLKTTFTDNPQLPFEDFHLHFFGGSGGTLRTPPTCATYTTTSEMTPWTAPEGADATPGDSFELDQAANSSEACPHTPAQQPDAPSFTSGTAAPKAGAYSPFVLHLARADGSQEIKQIDTTLPPGLTAKLAGVAECSGAQIAQARSRSGLGQGQEEIGSPSCPLSSELGKVTVAAGAGPDPFYVTGHAYLAGPYKGAPLSMAIVTPALAGPFDLGAVVVQTALYVDPETAQITARSDEIPHILQGIPLDVRSVDLQMNRPDFTLNPTDCEPLAFSGEAISTLGQSAPLSSPFQVGECGKLGFKPKLKISLKGKTNRAGNPALRATLTMVPGEANIARAQVNLPHSEFLDNAHIGTVCTKVAFSEGNQLGEKCPAASIYGYAKAESPLLEKPVEGPVYLRSPINGHKLPDLVAALNGQISVSLVGKVDTGPNKGIRNTFEVVPDAPVTKFTLSMDGGSKGLLENSENICSHPQKALAHFTAQNGKVDDFSPTIANSCKSAKKHHKRRSAHR